MPVLINILGVLLVAVLDRFRGDDELGFRKNVDAFLMGLVLAFLGGIRDPSQMALFSGVFTAAMAVGYGTPWGAALNNREMGNFEWWQAGPLKSSALASLAVRGLFGLPLIYWLPAASVGVLCGFVIAPYAARALIDYVNLDGWIAEKLNFKRKPSWNLAELIRGGTIGLCVVVL